ncbi:AraC family transcriptional regulator [Streptomyces sp. MBT42]|uniref:AraC family transcriptional regulator n=1 Tax=Streptomyces sp. MBT42 TaxID=1488373 RepID=UPI001E659B5A|nr:AraC family transcriptional regulator [Streptomyces sp. MBT42]MCD2468145.1 AraC family transcriptional regulator [Streptomyces sp. MBT42]
MELSIRREATGMLTRSVSAHHVRAVLLAAERCGVATGPLLARAGLSPALADEPLNQEWTPAPAPAPAPASAPASAPGMAAAPAPVAAESAARVPAEQFGQLVRMLWATLDDELIGLGGAPSKVGTFATMAHVVVHGSRDLREALRRAGTFYSLFPGGPRFRLVEPVAGLAWADGVDEARMEFDVSGYDDPLHFGAESTVLVAHRFAGWLVRRRIGLRRVEFVHPEPRHAREYALLYGAPCVFGAARTAAVFDRADLDEPVLRDAAALKVFLRRAPVDVLVGADYGSTATGRVRHLIGRSLPAGPVPTPEELAGRLSVSPQTLRRQLAAEGTTYQRLRDQVRRDHALAELSGGRISIERLSRRLGFSEPSAFHRAFRRWTGETPRAYQARARARDRRGASDATPRARDLWGAADATPRAPGQQP